MISAAISKWYSRARTPLLMCIGHRLAIFAFVYVGLVINPRVDHPWRAFPKNLMLDGWFRWDSGWYLRIVQRGYEFDPHEVQLPINCFPLYPLLVRGLAIITDNPFIAAFIISNVALLLACVLLYRLVDRKYGETVATNTLGLMLCYPFSFFMSAMYTEALFLLEVVGAFYFAQRNRWLLASICVAAASATRVVGILAAIPVALTYLQRISWRPSGLRTNILWLLVCPLGLGSYMLFLYLKLGDPLAFYRAQWVPGWGASFTVDGLRGVLVNAWNWQHIVEGTYDGIAISNVMFGALALLVCAVGYRQLGFAASLWGIVTMMISLKIWGCAGRYSSVIWPMYVGLALAIGGRRILLQSVIGGFCLLQALFVLMFTHGQPLF